MSETLPARNPDGTFPEGVSGNPRGRPLGRKNQITKLKQELEIAVRDHLRPQDIRKVLGKMVELAQEGNVGAAKLVLDKVLSNAKEAEEEGAGQNRIIFEVKNLTLKHDEQPNLIDVTPQEHTHVDRSQAGESDSHGSVGWKPADRKAAERTDS